MFDRVLNKSMQDGRQESKNSEIQISNRSLLCFFLNFFMDTKKRKWFNYFFVINFSRPDTGRRVKINLNFCFHTSLWGLKCTEQEGLIKESLNLTDHEVNYNK